MNIFLRCFLAVYVFCSFFSWSQTTNKSESINVKVIEILDGDTIRVINEKNIKYKVRMLGIDAPELKQPYGFKSREELAKEIYNKDININFKERDVFGRILGKIIIDGKDINLKQIEYGYAWYYPPAKSQQSIEDHIAYLNAEKIAKEKKIGLWETENPIPPWVFRKAKIFNL